MNKKKGWVVKNSRPEETIKDPKLYYTEEEVKMYSRSGGMKKAQQKIAHRILEILNINPKLKQTRLLDLGCGPGFTTEVYKSFGYDVIGLDIIPFMLKKAEEKSIKVLQGDMRSLSTLFKQDEFDVVASASALQWLKNPEDIKLIASGIYKILKPKGKLVIQFYPKSEKELYEISKIFTRVNFQGNILIDNPENPRKRLIFLALEKP